METIISLRPENEEQNARKVVTIKLVSEDKDNYFGIPIDKNIEPLQFPKYAWVKCHIIGGIVFDVDWE